MSGRKPSAVESEQENEQDSEQIEMVKNTAQEPDETSAELVVVSDGLREKRKVETGEKSPHVRESGFRNPGIFCLWNPESWALESGIQH